jgi:hypothetical protein
MARFLAWWRSGARTREDLKYVEEAETVSKKASIATPA